MKANGKFEIHIWFIIIVNQFGKFSNSIGISWNFFCGKFPYLSDVVCFVIWNLIIFFLSWKNWIWSRNDPDDGFHFHSMNSICSVVQVCYDLCDLVLWKKFSNFNSRVPFSPFLSLSFHRPNSLTNKKETFSFFAFPFSFLSSKSIHWV